MTKAATNERDLMGEFQKMLKGYPLRLDFSFGFMTKGTVPTATFSTKNDNNRWVAFKPFLAGKFGETRADLFQQLATTYRQADGEAASQLAIVATATQRGNPEYGGDPSQGGDPAYDVFDRLQASDEEREFVGIIRQDDDGEWLFSPERNMAWTPAELEQVSAHIRSVQRGICTRCGVSVTWDKGDSAWSDAEVYNLICVEGSAEDGSDALGHVLA